MRSLRGALQNNTELLWRLFLAAVAGGLVWLWIDDAKGVLIFGSMPAGMALGYEFARRQSTFRHRLHSIGVWTIGIGAALFVCLSALAVGLTDQPPADRSIVWYLLATPTIFVVFFGVSVRGEARKL